MLLLSSLCYRCSSYHGYSVCQHLFSVVIIAVMRGMMMVMDKGQAPGLRIQVIQCFVVSWAYTNSRQDIS